MRFTIGAFTTAAMIVALAAATLATTGCPRTPEPAPQAQQPAEVPPPAAAPVPLDPPPILRAPPGTPGHTVSTPAAAPKVAASKAKAAPKTAKPEAGEEKYAEAQARFYAMHADCLREVVDIKIAGDISAGKIRDFGNIRETNACGYDYFDPATGRLPPYQR